MTRIYKIWIAVLAALLVAGIWCYLRQMDLGLGITGMSRDVTWGLYIGQFTFADGLAASAVLLVLPCFPRRLALYGQFIAIAGVIACMLFIVADLGQPSLALNVLRYASPHSVMFWDMVALGGFLALNVVIATVTMGCEHKDVPAPGWVRPMTAVLIFWAIGMQTISAFLYCGLPGRSSWLTAILAPRFIASALVSGPALLILVLLVLRQNEAVRKLADVVTWALALNLFFILLESFSVYYSRVPGPMEHFHLLDPWMWISLILAVVSLSLLLGPRRGNRVLTVACMAAFASVWIDKGLLMVVGGFVPSPLGTVTEYTPTVPEIMIGAGIWAAAALIATLLFRPTMAARAYAGGTSELLLPQEVTQ